MSTTDEDEGAAGTRVAKWLAHAGVASRRASEGLVREGRVEVDGVVVTDLATKVTPDAEVKVDGSRIRSERMAYFMLNKPKGVVCTNTPLELRPRAIDLVTSTERVYPVGRLDEDSEGLLFLTNDGELAHRLTHPSFEIPKTYHVKVHGRVEKDALAKIRDGIYLAEGKTAPVEIYVKRRSVKLTTLEMVLREGINREIRRMLAKVEHPVISLRRVSFGPLELNKLPIGGHRRLSPREIVALQRVARDGPGRPKKPALSSRPQRNAESAPDAPVSPPAQPKSARIGAPRIGTPSRPARPGRSPRDGAAPRRDRGARRGDAPTNRGGAHGSETPRVTRDAPRTGGPGGGDRPRRGGRGAPRGDDGPRYDNAPHGRRAPQGEGARSHGPGVGNPRGDDRGPRGRDGPGDGGREGRGGRGPRTPRKAEETRTGGRTGEQRGGEPRRWGPRSGGDGPRGKGPRSGGDGPRGKGPRSGGDGPRGKGPRSGGDGPRGKGPRSGGDAPRGKGPRSGGDAPRGKGPRSAGDAPRGKGPRSGGDAPRGKGPRSGGDAPRGKGPRSGGDAPRGKGPRSGGAPPRGKGTRSGGSGPRGGRKPR